MRFFGDGFQKSKVINDHRYWRVPVMDGEFVVSETAGMAQGVAGGNIIIQGNATRQYAGRRATKCERAASGVGCHYSVSGWSRA